MHPGDTIEPKNETNSQDHPGDSGFQAAPQPDNSSPIGEFRAPDHTDSTPKWQYSGEQNQSQDTTHYADMASVSWTASEFIDHEKSSGWFVSLAAFTGLAVVVTYLISKDWITVVAILVAACLFGVTAKRRPRTLQYDLDSTGVRIGGKPYAYADFKSYSVIEEGAFNSIQLMPLKRFLPPISLYFPPEQEEQIVDLLADYLPHEDRDHDPIDRLMKRMHF